MEEMSLSTKACLTFGELVIGGNARKTHDSNNDKLQSLKMQHIRGTS